MVPKIEYIFANSKNKKALGPPIQPISISILSLQFIVILNYLASIQATYQFLVHKICVHTRV